MLESKDILFIVLAFCALWFTAFMCWFIFQITIAIKALNDLMADVKYQIERVEHALHGVKSKFDAGTSHVGSLAEQVKKAVSDFGKK